MLNLKSVILGLLLVPALFAELRVMSFNVRYPSKGDGENIWENRRDLLVETIRKHTPDVVGTQELFYTQAEYIVEKLPEFGWFGVSRRGNREDEHMGVFYRKSSLELLQSGNFWLSETPEVPGSISWNMSLPRMVTWAEFRDKRANKKLFFYNTHFAHRREDDAARVESAKLIVDRLKKLPAEATIVLTGDFNTDLESEPHRILAGWLQDSYTAAPKQEGPRGTFHGFKGTPGDARIDWILFRNGLQPTVVQTIASGTSGRYPSDHFPVLTVFDWQ